MIDFQLVRDHLKADGDDDALIGVYLTAAVATCESICNRKIYATADERDDDYPLACDDARNLKTAYDAAIAAASDDEQCNLIRNRYIADRAATGARVNGLVLDGHLTAAVLKLTGYYYRQREDGGTPTREVMALLEPYMWPGELAGTPA